MAQLARRNDVHTITAELLGGTLRSADPRRFVVEAMVCAMNADGVVDPREVAVLRRHLAGHPLFIDMPPVVADTMISLATDAMEFAGGPYARIEAIAAGLPSRIHRLTAYGMAVQIVRADGELAPSELAFLDRLRARLHITTDDSVERIHGLVPAAARLFALRAHTRGGLDDTGGHVRELFRAIADLAEGCEDALSNALAAPAPETSLVHDELRQLADAVPDAIDRWWLAVYVLADEPAAGRAWRRSLFGCLLQSAFGLAADDLDLASEEAKIIARASTRRG